MVPAHRRLIAIAEFIKSHPDCTVDDVFTGVADPGNLTTVYNNLRSLETIQAIVKYRDGMGVVRYKRFSHAGQDTDRFYS